MSFAQISSAPSRVAALLAGDVDVISGVPTTDIETLKGKSEITLSQGPSNRVIYLHMDQFRENSPFITAKDGSEIKNPLLDVRVRKAISMAINRDVIVERCDGRHSCFCGSVAAGWGSLVCPTSCPHLAYDPDGAQGAYG